MRRMEPDGRTTREHLAPYLCNHAPLEVVEIQERHHVPERLSRVLVCAYFCVCASVVWCKASATSTCLEQSFGDHRELAMYLSVG